MSGDLGQGMPRQDSWELRGAQSAPRHRSGDNMALSASGTLPSVTEEPSAIGAMHVGAAHLH